MNCKVFVIAANDSDNKSILILSYLKLKPGLVAFYDIQIGNGAGLFSKKKISKGGDEYGISEEKTQVGKHTT